MQFFMYRLLPLILNMSLTASVVILAVLLARLILKRAPRRYSYALWAVVLFRLLCPASFSSALSLLSLASAPAGAAAGEVSMVDYIPMDVVHNAASAVELPFGVFNDAVNSALPQGAEQTGAEPLEAPVCFLTILWCLVAAGMIFAGLVKYFDLRLRLWDSQKLEGRVRSSKYISTAFAAGIFRPRIYLPERLTERERDCVLAHERSHIRRGDHIIKPLAYLALCVHWFNPLVWLAWRLALRDMEDSCDEAAIRRLGPDAKADYAQTLLNLATGRRSSAGAALAFGDDVERRIKGVANMKIQKKYAGVLAGLLALAVIAGCAANPAEPPETPEPAQEPVTETSPAEPTGMCATAEEAAVIYQPGLDTVEVGVAGGEVRAANVTDRRITDFQKVCEIEGLAEGAVVEGYTYKSWCTLDLPVNEIMLAGDMELDGDWICLDGTMLGYALRYPDGSYDPCGWLVLNDRAAQYESYSELVWDEYCSARGLTPLYIVDLRHELGSEENSPFRRFDGDGWYIYLPLSGWEINFDDIGVFSGPAGGGTAGVTLELMEGPGEDGAVVSRVDADGVHTLTRVVSNGDSHYLLTGSWGENVLDSQAEAGVQSEAVVRLIMESFTLWDGHPEILA